MPIRDITLTVGSQQLGHGVLRSYPVDDGRTYLMPLYTLTVDGLDGGGQPMSKSFRVFRFGIYKPRTGAAATVVGLANEQSYVIKKYKADYPVHSHDSSENGAWVVHKTFYIHDGADSPETEKFGTIGCVEICDQKGFTLFNNFLASLSGSTRKELAEQLQEIAASGKMVVKYQKAARPPLTVRK
jgi:hypothetical protein